MGEVKHTPGPRAMRRSARTPEQIADARHTPGPWRTEFTDQYSAVGAHQDVRAIDGTVIASVIGTGEKCRVEPETVANVLLIAAAPDLLDACEAAAEALEGSDTRGDQRVREFLLAAIAKAKGGA